MQGLRLENLTWPEAETLLPERVLLLPLGARLKEHGLHLPLNNDWLLAEYFAERVLKECPVLLAPTIPFGFFPAFTEYPGSVHIEKQTFISYLLELTRSFSRHGARRIYVLNMGISTNWTLEPVKRTLAQEDVLLEYTDLFTVGQSARDSVRTQAAGTHADEIETSMMLYIAPKVVDLTKARPDIGENRPGPLTRRADSPRGTYSPTGAFGDPTRATVEKGRIVVEATVQEICAHILAMGRPEFRATPENPRYV